MSYKKVVSHIWRDLGVRELSKLSKLLWSYLINNEHINSLGLYYMPVGYVIADLQFNQKEFADCMAEIEKAGMLAYDERCCFVLLKKFLKHNAIANQKHLQGAISQLTSLPRTPLIAKLRDALQDPEIYEKTDFNFQLLQHLLQIVPPTDSGVESSLPPAPGAPPAPPTPPEKPPEKLVTKPEHTNYYDFINLWNTELGSVLGQVTKLTDLRKSHIRARLKEHPFPEWKVIFQRIAASPFLTGMNDKNWKADFDWFISGPDKIVRVLEGRYDDHKNRFAEPPKKGLDAIKSLSEKWGGSNDRGDIPQGDSSDHEGFQSEPR